MFFKLKVFFLNNTKQDLNTFWMRWNKIFYFTITINNFTIGVVFNIIKYKHTIHLKIP